MPTYPSSQRHPLESMGLLIGLMVAGAIIFTILAVLAAKAIYPASSLMDALTGRDEASLGYMKIIQIFSTIGTFIVPALIFAWLESGNPGHYLRFNNQFSVFLYLFAVILLFASMPMLELTVQLNQKMRLPEFLHNIEEWMRQKEDEMTLLTKQLLAVRTPAGLLVNLVMVAILPAIGEEFFFRGCLQNTIWRWVKNYHVAIWIAAFIFSAIHLQFYGFLPRMLLGALLGYLYVWGKSIWLPVIAHFANNATSVVLAYVYFKQGKLLDDLEKPESYNIAVYIISIVLTGALLWQYYRFSQTQEEELTDTDGEQLG